MIGWRIRTGTAWTVSLLAGASPGPNTRAGTAVNPNPFRIGPGWIYGSVTFVVTGVNGCSFDKFKIFGSHESIGFPPPGDYAAGAPNAVASAATFGGFPGLNAGQFRVLGGLRQDAGPNIQAAPLPEWLMLEFDTVAGAGGSSSFRVDLTLMGPEITGRG